MDAAPSVPAGGWRMPLRYLHLSSRDQILMCSGNPTGKRTRGRKDAALHCYPAPSSTALLSAMTANSHLRENQLGWQN